MSQTMQGSNREAPEEGRFSFSVEIDQAGVYGILLRGARDTNSPPDARNDIWIQIDGDTSAVMPDGSPRLVSGGDGFVKYKGAQTSWVNARMFSSDEDGVPNPASDVVFGSGLHTVVFAPRSTGYHIDSVQVVLRSLLPEEPDPEILTTSAVIRGNVNDAETIGGLADADLDLGEIAGAANAVGLRFRDLDLPAGAEIEEAHFVFTASGDAAAGGSLAIEMQDYVPAKDFERGQGIDARNYLDTSVAWDHIGAWTAGETYRSPDISALIEAVAGDGGLDAQDALAFRITGDGTRAVRAFEAGSGAPELVISYVELA
jgi:hypothetical protein